MSGTEISCIVPVFNGEAFLAAAVESVLAQTLQPAEILVVDDGSTDGTARVALGFGDRVRYIRQENAGPATARNTGLAHATGAFIGFLDADDLWHPEKLALQREALDADPGLGFCVALAQNFWPEDLESEQRRFQDHPRGKPVPAYVTGTLLARRSAFDRVGRFDPARRHGDSADWFLRARTAGVQGILLQEVLMYRRMHRDSRSRTQAEASQEEFLAMLKASLDRRRGTGPA